MRCPYTYTQPADISSTSCPQPRHHRLTTLSILHVDKAMDNSPKHNKCFDCALAKSEYIAEHIDNTVHGISKHSFLNRPPRPLSTTVRTSIHSYCSTIPTDLSRLVVDYPARDISRGIIKYSLGQSPIIHCSIMLWTRTFHKVQSEQ